MKSNEGTTRTGLEIAVIGMSGRFPGSENVGEFWSNLVNGIESIRVFSDKELEEAGIDKNLIKNPNYIKAKGYLDGVENFDAEFFGYSDAEARAMDPQMRLFHETVWSSLEDSGYVPDNYKGLIGLYGGATNCVYWELLSFMESEKNQLEQFAIEQLNNKDYLCTRVSYKLNLKGPSVFVQTGCSSSLVAINMACRALLTGECNIAVAGGVKISVPHISGYMYHEGLIYSSDGNTRAFDENSNGFVSGDGIGVVVLKPLKQAIEDRDNIYAVIKGNAINNDGIRKVGFTAPSVEGQADVIKSALRMARVSPESISYIETHGTATALGDPIEIEGLRVAFNTDNKEFCRIGSVKNNIGHLDSAAGVASLIKVIMCLKYRLIPPTINFKRANPKLDLENSPFYIHTGLTKWVNKKYPLRAGVSSFGVGGTNAHTILEEAPENEVSQDEPGDKLIVFSAKTEESLNEMTRNLEAFLHNNPEINLSDMAYTLQIGRKAFNHRRMLVCSSVQEAIHLLGREQDWERISSTLTTDNKKHTIFMFSGQGSQYTDMGLELYNTEPVFRDEMTKCFDILKNLSTFDMKNIIYPINGDLETIYQTEFAQPLLFAFEYALAKTLIKWGIEPYAMIGHSIGEYVAACLSGVFSLEDALKIVVNRGKLMQKMPRGAMVSIAINEESIIPLLNNRLSLSVINEEFQCVVGGNINEIESFEGRLSELGYQFKRLRTSHAFHSYMMDPILDEFKRIFEHVKFSKPSIPYISNISGKWITVEEATSPEYWVRHLRETVRFFDGITELITSKDNVFIEVGPGITLNNCVKNHKKCETHDVVSMVKHPNYDVSDRKYLLKAIGYLWNKGVDINWKNFNYNSKRYRISLPTYPFRKIRHWINGNPLKMMEMHEDYCAKQPINKWLYTPVWKRDSVIKPNKIQNYCAENILIFSDANDIGEKLQKSLSDVGNSVILVKMGESYNKLNEKIYEINIENEEDYDKLFKELRISKKIPNKIVHLLNTGNDINSLQYNNIYSCMDTSFYSLTNIAKAANGNSYNDVEIIIITDNMYSVIGNEQVCPEKALVLGPTMVIGKEYPGFKCRIIDITIPDKGSDSENKLISNITSEVKENFGELICAYRNNSKWIRVFENINIDNANKVPSLLKEEGVYLITGGFGGIGFTLADYIVKTVKGKIILVSRTRIPAKKEWKQWLEEHDMNNEISVIIRNIEKLESLGSDIIFYSADVSDINSMREVINQIEKKFKVINGVIHAAGIPDGGIIEKRSKELTEKVMAPKVKGIMVLDSLLKNYKLDFFVLCSSMASVISEIGEVAYVGANSFLDAFASYRSSRDGMFTVSINWDEWANVGMAVKSRTLIKEALGSIGDLDSSNQPILPEEGAEVFEKILKVGLSQVAISTKKLETRLKDNTEKFSAYESNKVESNSQEEKHSTLQENFYTPSWHQQELTQKNNQKFGKNIIVFVGEDKKLDLTIIRNNADYRVIIVRSGNQFEKVEENDYIICPYKCKDYDTLINEICNEGRENYTFIYLWNYNYQGEKFIESLNNLAQSICRQDKEEQLGIEVISIGASVITGEEAVSIENVQITGAIKYITQRYPQIRCINIDIQDVKELKEIDFIKTLIDEMQFSQDDMFIAYRGINRFVLKYELATSCNSISNIKLKKEGVYVIVGGLSGIGYILAKNLIKIKGVKVAIIENINLHIKRATEWCFDEYEIAAINAKNAADLEKLGVEIIENLEKLEIDNVLKNIRMKKENISGIILTPNSLNNIHISKILDIEKCLEDYELDFVILCSLYSNPLEWAQAMEQYRIESIYNALALRLRNKNISATSVSLEQNKIATHVQQICDLNDLGGKTPFLYEKIVDNGGGRKIYVSKLSAQNCWLLNEHRIGGKAIFPGTGYLEMVMSACEMYLIYKQAELHDVFFLEPMILDETEIREIRTIIEKKDEYFEFSIMSLSSCHGNEWCTHAVGKILFVERVKSDRHNLNEIQQSFDGIQVFMREKPYKEFGPRWSCIQNLKHGVNIGTAFLKLPEKHMTDEDDFIMHPALLDCATGFMMDYIEGSHIPFSYKKIQVKGALKGEVFSCIKCAKVDKDDTITFNILITDKDGNELVVIDEFTLKTVSESHLVKKQEKENYCLSISSPGLLNTMSFKLSERIQPGYGCVEIEVQEIGLNFKDILLAINPYMDSNSNLDIGMECVGKIVTLGQGVEGFVVGEEVIVIGSGLFSRFAVIPASNLIHKPEKFSLEHAATTFGVFTTAYHSLINLARISKGEKVLIHAATGGVGLAAVQIAQMIGAEIFATAGSGEKRAYLRSLGIKHVMNSRTLEFADEIMSITGGKGVDVVLNSLGGGEFIPKSLSVLRPYGRFIELGKRDILEGKKIDMSLFKRGISFNVVDVGPEIPTFKEMVCEIIKHFEKGDFTPLEVRKFPASKVADAFEFMAAAKHVGKVLVSLNEDNLLKKISYPKTLTNTKYNSICNVEDYDYLKNIFEYTKSTILIQKSKVTNSVYRADKIQNANTIELEIFKVFNKMLGLKHLKSDDNFFEAGVDSLTLVRAYKHINSLYPGKLGVQDMFACKTISKLVQLIEQKETSKGNSEKTSKDNINLIEF